MGLGSLFKRNKKDFADDHHLNGYGQRKLTKYRLKAFTKATNLDKVCFNSEVKTSTN